MNDLLQDNSKLENFERVTATAPWGHSQAAHKIAGKKIWYKYAGDYIFEHHYVDEEYIVWKGIGDETTENYTQKDRYTCFEIAPEIYLITWCEETTIANPEQAIQYPGPWPVFVVADFNKLIASVSFVNPTEDGKSVCVIDQARLEIKE